MNWYSAELHFATFVAGERGSLLESLIILLSAEDRAAAEEKAARLARAKEHSYANSQGEQVEWRFIETGDIQELEDFVLEDGAEVFSTLSRVSTRPTTPQGN